MKRTLLIFVASAYSVYLFAQRGEISGTISDKITSDNIPYSTIYLLQNGVTTNYGTVSDENGAFSLQQLSYGSYDLVVSFMGFRNDTLRGVNINKEFPNQNVGIIQILPSDIQLEGVEVTAMASTISAKIDRQVFRAADFETARGGTATDMLNKIPSVSVSPDGEVSVRGTADFIVYLNGKPTQMDPSMLLGQISSDNIDNIEVITVPSSKYDSQGKGGIVNINTKTRGAEGLTVTENLLGGGAPWGDKTDRYSDFNMNDYRYNGNFAVVYSKNRLNLYGGVNYSMKNVNGNRTGDARIYDPMSGAFKHMVASGERPEWYINSSGNAGFELDLLSGSSLSGSFFIGKRTEGRSAFYFYHNYYADQNSVAVPGVPLNNYWVYNPNTDNRFGTFRTASLEYDQKISNRAGIKFSGLYENSGLSRELDNYNYDYDPITDLPGELHAHFNQMDNTPLTGYRFSADYYIDLNENMLLEIGLQPQFFGISGDFSYDTLGIAGNMVADYSSLENSLELSRNVYAAYVNYSGNLNGLNYIVGLRGEYTDQAMNIENPDYFSIFDRMPQSVYSVKKMDWFPTIHLGYEIGSDQIIFAASRRINRPPIKNMAPFLYRRHYEVYVVGDPDLKPEYSNSVEVTYDKKINKSNVTLTGFFRGVDNAVFRVNTVYYDELVLIRSYTNSGSTSALGGELNANIGISKGAKLFIGGSLYSFRVRGEAFGYEEDNSSTNWSLKGALNLNLSKQLKWITDFDMQSATVTAQGRNEMFYFLNTAVNFAPAKLKRWSFTLKGLDLLASNIKGLDTRAYNNMEEQIFFQKTTYYRYGPIVELGLIYSFNSNGKKVSGAGSEFGNKEF